MMAEGKIIDVAVKKTSTGYNNNILDSFTIFPGLCREVTGQ
jgi:hypothetical protein